MIEKLCRQCGRTFPQYSSISRLCGTCAYNKYAKPAKPMKRIGKVGKQWIADRKQWIEDHPPNHQGYWECAIRISPQCLGVVDIDQLQVDHVVARTRDQSKRRQQTNLQPSCSFCNEQKGSTEV